MYLITITTQYVLYLIFINTELVWTQIHFQQEIGTKTSHTGKMPYSLKQLLRSFHVYLLPLCCFLSFALLLDTFVTLELLAVQN